MEMTPEIKVLIVEDLVEDAELIEIELRRARIPYTVKRVDTRQAFLDALVQDHPDIVISDYNLPGFDGISALLITQQYAKETPFIMVTGSVNEEIAISCIRNGAKDYVIKEHLDRLGLAVLSSIEQRRSTERLNQSYKMLQRNFRMFVEAMSRVVEIRDPYTAGHQKRVADLAVAIATEMGLDAQRIEGLMMAGMLHDIGKVCVPAEILSKPGRLNSAERMLIRMHSEVGATILQPIDFPWPVSQIIAQHHEKMDGSGYGAGLKGEDILLEARILCVADVVEAIASHRPYRAALGLPYAIAEISKNAGVLYDPLVVQACTTLFQENRFAFDVAASVQQISEASWE